MKKKLGLLAVMMFCLAFSQIARSQTTEITYQGQLQSSSAQANGSYDFEFLLFDTVGGGAQVGSTISRSGVSVTNGIFSVNLDFGPNFPGPNRFLEIRVRQSGAGAFTTLTPRQPVTSTPYSIKSQNADVAINAANATNATTAVNATNLTGNLSGDVTGTQITTTVTRLQGRNVSSTPPLAGQVLKFNGTTNQWVPDTDIVGSGGGGGTITGVTPGTGLNGGGATGNVTLNIANGGVGTVQLADNSITDAKINGVSGSKVTGAVANATDAANAAQLGGLPSSQYLQTNGNGSGLTNLNSSNITTGTLANSRLGQIPTANIADNAVTAPKIASGQVVKTLNSLTDNVTLTAGSNITITPSGNTLTIASTSSGNPILNQTTTQAGANFNISGSGTAGGTLSAGIVNAATQYNLGGVRVFDTRAIGTTLVGEGSGASLSTGNFNSFFGTDSGRLTTSGESNSFFGDQSGRSNTTGSSNAFFGVDAGRANTTGDANSFFGRDAGSSTTTGANNAFFGNEAGRLNTTGFRNSFFGVTTGNSTTSGNSNSFFGVGAGFSNTTGSSNAFVGIDAGGASTTGNSNVMVGDSSGRGNTTGSNNVFLGAFAGSSNTTGTGNVGLGPLASVAIDLTNATAIGGFARVTQSNSIVLGSINGVNGATADSRVGIGVTAPTAKLTVGGSGAFNASDAARFDLFNSVANVGYIQHVGDTGLWQLGTAAGSTRMVVTSAGDVGIGVNAPAQQLDVAGNIRVGTGTTGCVQDRDGTLIAGTCSSDLRFKKNVASLGRVLPGFAKLRPVTFDWRADEFKERHFGTRRSFGLIAQDVEQAFPDLVTTDEAGFRAVNYSKLPMLTIQAVIEQQAIIESQQRQLESEAKRDLEQQKQIERQQADIDALKALVCKRATRASICKRIQ